MLIWIEEFKSLGQPVRFVVPIDATKCNYKSLYHSDEKIQSRDFTPTCNRLILVEMEVLPLT